LGAWRAENEGVRPTERGKEGQQERERERETEKEPERARAEKEKESKKATRSCGAVEPNPSSNMPTHKSCTRAVQELFSKTSASKTSASKTRHAPFPE
jgi:hypothetical protein